MRDETSDSVPFFVCHESNEAQGKRGIFDVESLGGNVDVNAWGKIYIV